MESLLTSIIGVFIVYGGSYAAALATASSFFAVFLFFWARTGERKNIVCLDTKKIYLPVIYGTLRISLYIMSIAYIAEILLVRYFVLQNGLEISAWALLGSMSGFFVGVVLLLQLINSTLMIHRKMPLWFGLPFAIVSYLMLFIADQYLAASVGIDGFLRSAFPGVFIAFGFYIALILIGIVVFNHFSSKVRGNLQRG